MHVLPEHAHACTTLMCVEHSCGDKLPGRRADVMGLGLERCHRGVADVTAVSQRCRRVSYGVALVSRDVVQVSQRCRAMSHSGCRSGVGCRAVDIARGVA